jgi:hypothetical protein
MGMIPSVFEFILLALAAFRLWKLIGDDAILDVPRDRLLERVSEGWTYFVTCPWCLGAWSALAWWLAWIAWPYGAVVVAVPFALSAVVGYLGVAIDKLEG